MTKEELQYLTVHELRIIAREKGVKHPSMLNKGDLIDAIINSQNENTKIKRSERRGRRAHAGSTNIVIESTTDYHTINKIEQILNNAKNEILQLLKNKNT